jgi:cell wall-associated NlpC family hydrolase
MRRWILLTTLLAAIGTAGSASAAPSPAVQAKRAQARVVLAQVGKLDAHFGRIVDAWDGARIQLNANKRLLVANTKQLKIARQRSLTANRHLAKRLVAIYEDGEPSLVSILTGASTLQQLIDELETSSVIASADRRLADEAGAAQSRLAKAQLRLRATERRQRTTVAALDGKRRQIGTLLARRRRLLSSIQSQIVVLKAQEARRQAELAAAARARLAVQEAALAQKAAKAAAAAAAVPPPVPTPTTTATTPPTATTTPATTTTPAATATPPATTALGPVALPAGYPQAATIALRYLGVPYQWGGASPITGFDCSGLVMYVYAQLGVQLPHYAAAQYGYGVAVPFDQLQPGDLVFFSGLSHVGIYIGAGEIVHAPETGDVVKITPLAAFGSSYVGARRL